MREIKMIVSGDTVKTNQHRAGVKGSANSTVLVVQFDESWDSYSKKLVFWDALEQNPVERDLIMEEAPRTYRTTMPGEPLALAGECVLVIEGWTETVRMRAMRVRLTVEDAPDAEGAAKPVDPTMTQMEQMQVYIENQLQEVRQIGERVEKAAQDTKDYTVNPPTIGSDGNWYLWDGEKYVNSGVRAQGERGPAGYVLTEIDKTNIADVVLVSMDEHKDEIERLNTQLEAILYGDYASFKIRYNDDINGMDVFAAGSSANGTYQFIPGMTWREWCNSKYNTAGLYVLDEPIGTASPGAVSYDAESMTFCVVITYDYEEVVAADTQIEAREYSPVWL